jgi:hypothetical protein
MIMTKQEQNGSDLKVCIVDFVPEGESLVEGWLLKEFNQWAGKGSKPYGTIVAVSMFARMWTMPVGTPREVRETQIKKAIEGESPVDRAFEWFKPLAQNRQIVDKVLFQATTLQIWLRDEVYDLEEEVAAAQTAKDRWRTATHLVRWLLEREQLEGVHMMLRSAENTELESLLKHLDKCSKERITAICRKVVDFELEPGGGPPWMNKMPKYPGSLPDHPHLFAIFCRDPDAWWGNIAYQVSGNV